MVSAVCHEAVSARGKMPRRGKTPRGSSKGFMMRLALKLVLVFMLANIALAGIYGYLAVRREVILFQKRAAAEAEEMGPVIEKLLADAWRNQGRSRHRGVASQDHRRRSSSR